MMRTLKTKALPVLAAAAVVLGLSSGSAFAADLTSLIDFSQLATDIKPLISTAVTAAAGIGAVVLAAMVCWKFFKRFING